MKNIGFLGSGFALYGYLKYFSTKNSNLYTLIKYKNIIKNRKDLKKLYSKILFKNNDDEILEHCNKIVIARRPVDQEKFINKIIKRNYSSKFYYFEKPLCATPKRSLEVFNKLKKKKIRFSIGYLFLYTNLYSKFIKNYGNELNFDWEFMSYDLSKKKMNWKFNIEKGGGPLRFYGIHLISVLVSKFKKFSKVESYIIFKKKIPTIWECNLLADKKIKIRLKINSFSKRSKSFVLSNKKILYNKSNPFDGYESSKTKDNRIKFINLMILNSKKIKYYNIYKNSLKLWKKIENKNKYIYEM